MATTWQPTTLVQCISLAPWLTFPGCDEPGGCHDLTRMGGGKAQPAIVEMHAGLAKAGPVNCLDCHMGVGHVYEEPGKAASGAEGAAGARFARR